MRIQLVHKRGTDFPVHLCRSANAGGGEEIEANMIGA